MGRPLLPSPLLQWSKRAPLYAPAPGKGTGGIRGREPIRIQTSGKVKIPVRCLFPLIRGMLPNRVLLFPLISGWILVGNLALRNVTSAKHNVRFWRDFYEFHHPTTDYLVHRNHLRPDGVGKEGCPDVGTKAGIHSPEKANGKKGEAQEQALISHR